MGRLRAMNLQAFHDLVVDRFECREGGLWWRCGGGTRRLDRPAGTVIRGGYMQIRVGGRRWLAHRLIFFIHNPEWNIFDSTVNNFVDHRDHDTLNNDINNLRVATNGENQRNSVAKKGGTSRFKGVGWRKDVRKWLVRVRLDGLQRYGGMFIDEDEANARAIAMREELHGEFVRHG
jgi:hypothetical protein